MIITQKSYKDLFNMPVLKLFGGLIIRILQLLLLFLLSKNNIKLLNLKIFRGKKSVVSTGLVQIFIFTLFCMIFFWKGEYHGLHTIISQSLAFTLCLLTIIFGVINYKERENEMKVNYKLKLQETDAQNMDKLIGILRKNHHDIGNHLNTILAISQARKDDTLDRIEEYVSTLTNNVKSSFKSYDTGNRYLNGLLAVKYNESLDKGIRFEVDFDAKLDILDISDQVLISIVSNIIDNAFDAMENPICDAHKYITISGYLEEGIYNLSICNNGPAITKQSLAKIFELGYSTKDNINGYNGYGLYIVKQYVKENNGDILVTSSSDETEFLMKFPVH
jgi:sensor histidine kinase regulating citrate/malate metabolism